MSSETASSQPALVKPAGLAAPIGLYSHGSRVAAGSEMLFIAGQVAVGTDGQLVGQDDLAAQTRQVFTNLQAVLAAAGMNLGHVTKFTTYVSEPGYIEAFYQAREKLFAELYPAGDYPPNTLLVVSRLVRPEFMVEIEAVAARGPGV
jgi:2-iminobutanoate/2-iminopropanoate deaminase